MKRLEFLLEESSMANVLKVVLPKILPSGYRLNINYFLVPHAGKSDLQKSIPHKIKAFRGYHEPVMLIVLHDQHTDDCKRLKRKITQLFERNGVPASSHLIRIVCRELESWYLGDMNAIEKAYPAFKASRYKNKARFRIPDNCHAYEELSRMIRNFQKGQASKLIAPYLNIADNDSDSFKQFVSGLKAKITT